MADIYKFTLIFSFTPNTQLEGIASPGRQGGFSESYWIGRPTTLNERLAWADARGALMAEDVAIIGYRENKYSYTSNKLTPGATTVGALFRPGGQLISTNSPDDALRILAVTAVTNHNWTFFIRAIPDNQIASGQYIPGVQFKGDLGKYLDMLKTGGQIGQNIKWLGRDPTTPKVRVLSWNLEAGKLVVGGNLGVANGTDFIRFNRVYGSAGQPIKGSYLVTASVINPDFTVTYTLQNGPAGSVATPSGTCRKDQIAVADIQTCAVRTLGERKAGRPSLAYRGRRTRSR